MRWYLGYGSPDPVAGSGKVAAVTEFWVETTLAALKIFISWPVAVAVVALVLLLSRRATRRLAILVRSFGGFKSVNLFGAELVFGEEARIQADETLKEYRDTIWNEFKLYVNSRGLEQKLSNTCNSIYTKLGKKRLKEADARFTVHVPDALFTETFMQLLDYYPVSGGAGRTKSIRFGIIGKAWRSGRPEVEHSVPVEEERLIVEWGMTEDEARGAGSGRKSFAAVPLMDENKNKVAVFFMDAKPEGVFKVKDNDQVMNSAELEKLVRDACGETGLTVDLAGIREKVWEKGPRLNIHD